MTDGRDDAELRPIAVAPHRLTDPASTAGEERILLLECRLAQLRSQLESARVEADLARTRLADAAAREADHVRRYSAAMQELAEARAEIASLHRRLEHSEALRAQLEGQLFEPDAREDAEELVRLRRDILVERHRAEVHERAAKRLRERVEELQASRETILSHLAEWQELVRRDGPEAVDLARYMSDLRREILDLESRNALAERREAAYRRRLAMAGIDPDEVLAEVPEAAASPARPAATADDGEAEPAQEPEHRPDELPLFEFPLEPITAFAPEDDEPAHDLETDVEAEDAVEPGDDFEAVNPLADPWTAGADIAAEHDDANVGLAGDHDDASVDIAADRDDAGIGLAADRDDTGVDIAADHDDAGADIAADHEEAPVAIAADHEEPPVAIVADDEEAPVVIAAHHEEAPVDIAAGQAGAGGADSAADGFQAGVEPETAAPVEVPAEPDVVPGPLHALVAALENADLVALRAELRRCTRVCGEQAVLDAIRPWTEAEKPAVRAAAYEALGLLLGRNAAALEPFMRAGLNDPDGRVRRRVVLAAAAAQGLPLRSLLEPVRVDRDPQVRRVVLEVLRHLPPSTGEERRRSDESGVLSAVRPVA